VENRGFESNIIFISAVLGYNKGGAGGRVVGGGFQGVVGCVLLDWAGIGNRAGVVPFDGRSWTDRL